MSAEVINVFVLLKLADYLTVGNSKDMFSSDEAQIRELGPAQNNHPKKRDLTEDFKF